MAELSCGWGCAGGPATVTVTGVTAFAEGGVPALSLCFICDHPPVGTRTAGAACSAPCGLGEGDTATPGTLEVRIVLVCAIHLHGDLSVAFQYLNGL